VAAYYVIGIVLVIWALALTAVGLTRDGFPPSRPGGRGLIAVSALLVAATVAAVVLTSEREHPREEAKAEAAEKAEAERGGGAPGGKRGGAEGGPVEVVEREYSVKLAGGATLGAGDQTFDVANEGKIPHDLAVEGAGAEKKTPLIDPGDKARLDVALNPGKYKLYCTVPGHEQLGMKTEVTVR
jgi:plastocyanin